MRVLASRLSFLLLLLATAGVPAAGRAQSACPGDCNGDGRVSADELGTAIHAVFSTQVLDTCAASDHDANGEVAAAEVLRVVTAVISPDAACAPPATRWMPLPPLAGGPRQEVGVAALGATLYVIGGFDGTGAGVATVEAYDTTANTWHDVASLPQPRQHVGAAALAERVYSAGGFAGSSFLPANQVYAYDPDGDVWSAVAPLPTARGALALAALRGKLYAVGGSGIGGSVARHDVYDPSTNAWSPLAPLPSARNHLAAVAFREFLYVVGGRRDGAGVNNTAELDRYGPTTDRWDILAPMPTARSGYAAAVVNGRVVVMGGEVNPANPPSFVFPQVELYDPATDTWQSLAPMPLPRHGIGAVTVGGLIYVPGGATHAGFGATASTDALEIAW